MGTNSAIGFSEMEKNGSYSYVTKDDMEYKLFRMIEKENSFVLKFPGQT